MTTIELSEALSLEYKDPTALFNSYDGYTPTERYLTPDEVDLARNAKDYEPKTLAAAIFHVSNEVMLYFFFDLHETQIAFGD
jgi:hypothetical protein